MSERAFLDAIIAEPDEDLHRLVFADWLDENGQGDRAEFIRVQIDLDRLPPASPRVPDLRVREGELLLAHERRWLGEWADRLVHWEFRRGFLRAVRLLAEWFVRGEDLFARHPVQRVALVSAEGESLDESDVWEVCRASALRHVRALEVGGCVTGEPMCGMYGGVVHTYAWLDGLAGAAHAVQLRELALVGHTRQGRYPIDGEAWRRFCRADHLRSLARLDLSSEYSPDSPGDLPGLVAELTRATFAPSLRSLNLAELAISDEAASILARAERLSGLEELDLRGCGLGDDGMAAVLGSGSLARLRSLGAPYGPRLTLLAASPVVGRLRDLRLGAWGRRIGADEWLAFFRSQNLAGLTSFSLGTNEPIPEEAVAALMSAPWIGNLTELRLHFDRPTASGRRPLFERPAEGPTALARLSLRPAPGLGEMLGHWPGLAGVVELSLLELWNNPDEAPLDSPHLSARLSRLDLTGNCKTPENLARLANAPGLRGLRWLGFGYNELTPDRAAALAASPNLRHVESLHLGSEWAESGHDVRAALASLTHPDRLGRLRDVVVGSGTAEEAVADLRERFGARLRVWCDF
jgi:uncharacterized protein (TIGR02996 family)